MTCTPNSPTQSPHLSMVMRMSRKESSSSSSVESRRTQLTISNWEETSTPASSETQPQPRVNSSSMSASSYQEPSTVVESPVMPQVWLPVSWRTLRLESSALKQELWCWQTMVSVASMSSTRWTSRTRRLFTRPWSSRLSLLPRLVFMPHLTQGLQSLPQPTQDSVAMMPKGHWGTMWTSHHQSCQDLTCSSSSKMRRTMSKTSWSPSTSWTCTDCRTRHSTLSSTWRPYRLISRSADSSSLSSLERQLWFWRMNTSSWDRLHTTRAMLRLPTDTQSDN